MNPNDVTKVMDKILAEWADKGLIIEGGWRAFVAIGLQDAPPTQLQEMRKAYYLGAQHLYASMLAIIGKDDEPTEQDMRRMSLIDSELQAFTQSLDPSEIPRSN